MGFKGLLLVLDGSFHLPRWVEGRDRIALVSRGVQWLGSGREGAVERHSGAAPAQ